MFLNIDNISLQHYNYTTTTTTTNIFHQLLLKRKGRSHHSSILYNVLLEDGSTLHTNNVMTPR